MRDRLFALAREHLGVLLSMTSALVISMRVLAVSGFNVDTAYVILRSQDTGAVVFGTLLTVLPILPMVLAAVVMIRFDPKSLTKEELRWSRWLVAGLALTTSVMLPIGMVLVAALLASVAIAGTAGLRRLRRRPPKDTTPRLDAGLLGMVFALGVSVVFSPQPWLPREALSGDPDITGFVLDADVDQLIVLQDRPRVVLVVDADGFERTLCSEPRDSSYRINKILDRMYASPSAAGLLVDAKNYPPCPTE